MTALWLRPRGGEGSWAPSPPHHPATDVLVALLVCVLGGLLLLGLLVAGRAGMCKVHDQNLTYCDGYSAPEPQR